jgi:hypothetical protein
MIEFHAAKIRVTKNQGFIKILAFLSRRYLPAIQGMGDGTIPGFCRCCVLLRTCLPHIPPAKNRYRIFIMPVLRKIVLDWGKTGSKGSGKYW